MKNDEATHSNREREREREFVFVCFVEPPNRHLAGGIPISFLSERCLPARGQATIAASGLYSKGEKKRWTNYSSKLFKWTRWTNYSAHLSTLSDLRSQGIALTWWKGPALRRRGASDCLKAAMVFECFWGSRRSDLVFFPQGNSTKPFIMALESPRSVLNSSSIFFQWPKTT